MNQRVRERKLVSRESVYKEWISENEGEEATETVCEWITNESGSEGDEAGH